MGIKKLKAIIDRSDHLPVYEYIIGERIVLGRAIRSPLREEKNPSFNVFRLRTGMLYWHDFAWGQGDVYKLVMIAYECDFRRAVEIIGSILGIEEGDLVPPRGLKIVNQLKKIVSGEEKRAMIHYSRAVYGTKAFHDAARVLSKYHLRNVPMDMIPITEATVKKEGKEEKRFVWSPGMPMFAFTVGDDATKIYMPGRMPKYIGNTRMYDVFGFKELHLRDEMPTLIVAGHKDKVVASEHLEGIFQVCCFNSESVIPPDDVVMNMYQRSSSVYVFYDNDRAGRDYSEKLCERYPFIRHIDQTKYLREKQDLADLVEAKGPDHIRSMFQRIKQELQ